MSRGFLIELKLESDNAAVSIYSVFASGWHQPQEPSNVASLKINSSDQTYEVTLKSEWEHEEFYFPTYAQLLDASGFKATEAPINKKYSWWNVRLLSAITRILTNPKYREHVWFYQ